MSVCSHLRSNRRTFVKQTVAAGVAACVSGAPWNAPGQALPAPSHEAASPGQPLQPTSFNLLPLGSIRPAGWLLQQLRIQANGLSGHLDEAWADVGPNSGWLGGTGESWERGPYYLDGLVPLAYLLEDPGLKAKARKYIEWTLRSQKADGMFGPSTNDDWWPRMVMLKALMQYGEATGDARVVPFMHRYFLYQLANLPGRPLRDWGRFRWQDNVLTVLWTYNRTGDPKLLELAKLLHAQGYDWVGEFSAFPYKQTITRAMFGPGKNAGLQDFALSTHGVNNGQAIKAGPVWSMVSGSAQDRNGARQMLEELDRYHGMPNGMFSCDEHLAGLDPSHGSELCTVVESMYSLEQALAITGYAALGDRLEKLAFNALPGTMTDDMWAHQYNQEPNQVECSLHRKPWTTDGPESNLYGLEPNFGCCTANFNQGWPKFASSLVMSSEDGGLAVAAYSPCEAHADVHGTRVRLTQQTEYPFRGTVQLNIQPERSLRFPLHLRIPGWAQATKIKVNGALQPAPGAGTFAIVERTWKPGDTVEVEFAMTPRIVSGFHGSVSIERGPLVFSYAIAEDWLKLRDRGMTADWQVYPASPWNYALAVDPAAENPDIQVQEAPVSSIPFSRKQPPVRLSVRAKRLPAWVAVDGVANPLPQSPVQSDEREERIELMPYAAAKLRITSFPILKA